MTTLYRLSLQQGPTQILQQSISLKRLFDCDINLTHEKLKKDAKDLLLTAKTLAWLNAGIVPGSSIDDSLQALEIVSDEKLRNDTGVQLYSTFGVHPYYARGPVPDGFSENLESYLRLSSRIVAIGECGLDSTEGFPSLDDQLPWFRAQLDLACKLNKPLFLHERNAHSIFMSELVSRRDKLPKKLLLHCFTGTVDELKTYLDFGCWISISGLICRANKEGKLFQDVLRKVSPPSNRLLLETDAPYMEFPRCRRLATENPWATRPNIPSAIIQVAEAVSICLGRSLESVCEDSYSATIDFFEIHNDIN